MLWNPFLIYFFNKVVVGPAWTVLLQCVNSAHTVHQHWILSLKEETNAGKKKKKEGNVKCWKREKRRLSIQTGTMYLFGLCVLRVSVSAFWGFFFFFFSFLFLLLQRMNRKITWIYCAGDRNHCSCTVAALFTHCSSIIHAFKNIKNGFHSTIYTFKNYFATVFSVFSFKFQQQ